MGQTNVWMDWFKLHDGLKDRRFNANKHIFSNNKLFEKEHNFKQIKGCLWLTCGLIILEMKADNELAISLPVYFKSVKK